MISENNIYSLKEFVSKVKSDINIVVSSITLINPELKSLYPLIREAWENVSPRFEEIIEYLEGKRYIEKMEDLLESKGLTGVQLELKIKVFKLRRKDFQKAWDDFVESSEDDKEKKRPFIKRILQRFFRIIDRIFESLGFIPGTDAAKEMKGILEELI